MAITVPVTKQSCVVLLLRFSRQQCSRSVGNSQVWNLGAGGDGKWGV